MSQSPFILYRLPGDTAIRRCAFTGISKSVLSFGDVEVHPWCSETFAEPMTVCENSTPCKVYTDNIKSLVESLRDDNSKAVICRQICGEFSHFAPEDMAVDYFRKFPEAFCFLFYHPLTGYWMGASPELLLQSEGPKLAYTRALAGTKAADDASPWDAKNLVEHRIVVDDILSRLKGIDPSIHAESDETYDHRYSTVRHLCTPIRIYSDSNLPSSEIITALHPTPAVGGYPREKAMTLIEKFEATPRNCYGGLITVPTQQGPLTYVILRCVHFDSVRWAVYTGSGITNASDSLDEWRETEAKAAPLIELLSSF